MIKCNVTVCGTIGRIPVVRAGKEGKQFTTFGVNVQIPVKNAAKKLVEVSAIQDGGLAEGTAGLTIGTRVEVTGVLTFKKRGEALYLNLNAASITQVGADKPDLIQGDMHFRGKLGKTIEMKNDKKGNASLLSVQKRWAKNLPSHGCASFASLPIERTGWWRKQTSKPRGSSNCRCTTTD